MFGYVSADMKALSPKQRQRYSQAYCGLCRGLRQGASSGARLALSYDMAFLALLLMSLYEPEEETGSRACALHPFSPRPWTDNAYIRYAADMNLALAYYKASDDVEDDGSLGAKWKRRVFAPAMEALSARYPRQCRAMAVCMEELAALEGENCANPDLPANCFGALMAELLVYEEDLWAATLRKMGMALGRFIYLADAAADYKKDKKKGSYNPFLAHEEGFDPEKLEDCLVLELGKVTRYYESLPLVQDKEILDNILYSGIWLELRRRNVGRSI